MDESAARADFIETMGLIAQAEGEARTVGRLFGLIVFEGRAFSFSELARELQVSRASVSTSARRLESLGIIERTARPGDRQDYFRLGQDPYRRMLRGAADRAGRARQAIGRIADAMPAGEDEGRRRRVAAFVEFYGLLEDSVNAALDRLCAGGQADRTDGERR